MTYDEVITAYKELDSLYQEGKMITYGHTDCGLPLHLFVITPTKIFDPYRLHELNKCILFINNGIHPGEPDGIDASLQLAKDLLAKPLYRRLLDNVVVCIVPVFNIDGALQRGCCGRINQDGPEEYGFRANARNLDLNRDFMKADAKNTKSFMSMIRQWDPDVIVDTHVSDGADYSYTMTLIAAQHNKYPPESDKFMKQKLTPFLYRKMKEADEAMTPYVQTKGEGEIPDSGIVAFLETPRYLCGYASLFNSFCFISEAHMLKPFYRRVEATHKLLSSFVELCSDLGAEIIDIRRKSIDYIQKEKWYRFNWTCDTSRFDWINFKGYTAGYKNSPVTGTTRLYYDRSKPYEKKIPFYDTYYAKDSVLIPQYIYLPQAYEDLLKLMDLNKVRFERMQMDSIATVTAFYISAFETVKSPYEGHYLHSQVATSTQERQITLHKGDILIRLPQEGMNFILEAFTPRAVDSYFCWGFFDSFLQQKEWFSAYLYEDSAEALLKNNPVLNSEFTEWKAGHPDASGYEQLNFIYQRSPHFEKTYRRYPVFFIY